MLYDFAGFLPAGGRSGVCRNVAGMHLDHRLVTSCYIRAVKHSWMRLCIGFKPMLKNAIPSHIFK